MGYSTFKWLVIYDDGETEEIIAETIDEVAFAIHHDAQPRAIIKMNYC